MGEVYRARDARLHREVAIKVSAQRFSERFEKEVRAIASLNHPNISALYDVGPDYLVMELLEGSTLEERIQKGPMPLEEALAVARQLMDALEAAHDKGIIHRDLKPANIKITAGGKVKVLDFGLAKTVEAAPARSSESSPTQTIGATLPGQPWGRRVTCRRSRRAACRSTNARTLGLRRGAARDADRAAAVRGRNQAHRLLRSCLEKDPKQRLRDIGDAWRLLEEPPPAGSATSSVPWKVAAAAAIVLAVVSTISLWALWRTPQPAGQPLVTLNLDLGPGMSLDSGAAPAVDLSPDGNRIAFVSQARRMANDSPC